MMKPFLFAFATACLLLSCADAPEKKDEMSTNDTSQTVEKAIPETPAKLAPIHDESNKVDGAIACITQQFQLVQEGKFDEALEYYSKKRKEKIKAELDANPSIKKEWQAATKLSASDFNEMIAQVREDQSFFTFEEGMWKRLDR